MELLLLLCSLEAEIAPPLSARAQGNVPQQGLLGGWVASALPPSLAVPRSPPNPGRDGFVCWL